MIRRFVNSAPNQIPFKEDKIKIIGIFLSIVLIGSWIYFGGKFFNSTVGVTLDFEGNSLFFYNYITNLILELNAKGNIYSAAKLVVLRENYIKFIFSFVLAFLSLIILWKITNPPDEDLSLNTKYRRIGIVFSIVFIVMLLLRTILSTISILYNWF